MAGKKDLLIFNHTQPGRMSYQNNWVVFMGITGGYHSKVGGARGVIVIVVGNEHGDTSSNPGRDCISHSTNTLGKDMNPIILPLAMGK